jgi:hypothetical protein
MKNWCGRNTNKLSVRQLPNLVCRVTKMCSLNSVLASKFASAVQVLQFHKCRNVYSAVHAATISPMSLHYVELDTLLDCLDASEASRLRAQQQVAAIELDLQNAQQSYSRKMCKLDAQSASSMVLNTACAKHLRKMTCLETKKVNAALREACAAIEFEQLECETASRRKHDVLVQYESVEQLTNAKIQQDSHRNA